MPGERRRAKRAEEERKRVANEGRSEEGGEGGGDRWSKKAEWQEVRARKRTRKRTDGFDGGREERG